MLIDGVGSVASCISILYELWQSPMRAGDAIGAGILLLFMFWIGRFAVQTIRPKKAPQTEIVEYHHWHHQDPAA